MSSKRTYTRKEVLDLLSALERQCGEAAKLAQVAEHDASKHSFGAYREFRDKVGEFQSLYILIGERLKNVKEGRVDDLREQFERLDTVMLGLLVRASLRFFFVLSANPIMPIGARDIFSSELRSLNEAHSKLKSPEYADKLPASLENDLVTAELILEEIIAKAPGLLNFGARKSPAFPEPIMRR